MEFLKVNGIEIEPTEDNIVTVVKNILKNFTSDEAESLKNRIQNAESIFDRPYFTALAVPPVLSPL